MAPAAKKADDDSSEAEIPYRQKKDAKGKKDEAQEDPDDESMDEDEYVVEKLLAHMWERGKLKFEVKWEGWEETTWEPEENLVGCDVELSEYFATIGGRPQKPQKADAKKRKNSDVADKGAKKTKVDVSRSPPKSDAPTKWLPPTGSWEDHVVSIDTMERDDEGKLIVYIMWEDGRKTKHESQVVNKKCPQKMLTFYEAHLQFSGSGSNKQLKPVAKEEDIKARKEESVVKGPAPVTFKDEDAEEMGVKGVAMAS